MDCHCPPKELSLGVVLFEGVTQLDYVGPISVLGMLCELHLIHTSKSPVTSDLGLSITPTTTFDEVKHVDILLVPGSAVHSMNALLDDESFIKHIQRLGSTAKYVTSVCTGSLVLAHAGLLKGFRATSHWTALSILEAMGIEAVQSRVVRDGNRMTGGGVTAGIDFGLTLLAVLKDDETAKLTQLFMEYDPQPPFDSGNPTKAAPAAVELARSFAQAAVQRAIDIVQRV
ncbi:unnamed protein product [Parajaminaea phylloscopi]